jgi:3-oxoacyl-[acyl-carrier protein] reductase
MVADDAKVILVTGASRGLGASIALEMGKQGQKVVVNYAGSEAAALDVCEQIKALGGDAIAVQADCKLLLQVYYHLLPVWYFCHHFIFSKA